MFYKPKFCCNCGERIERVNWSLLTSRRFCDICEIEFKGHELFPKIGAVALILFGLFGTGSYWLAGGKTANLKPVQSAAIASNVRSAPENQKVTSANYANATPFPTQAATISPAQPLISAVKNPPNISPNPAAKTSELQTAGDEQIYFCGAATKKGTPCSRRVNRHWNTMSVIYLEKFYRIRARQSHKIVA